MKKRATVKTETFPNFIGEHCGREPMKIIEAVILLTNAKRAKAKGESTPPWSWAAFASMSGVEPDDAVLLDAQAVKPYQELLKRCRTPEAMAQSERHLLQQCKRLPEPLSQTFSEMIGWWTAENKNPILPLNTENLKKREQHYKKGMLSLDELQDAYLYSLLEGGGLSDWLDTTEAKIDLSDFNPTISNAPKVTSTSGIQVTTFEQTVGAINYLGGMAEWAKNPESDDANGEDRPLNSPRVTMFQANIRSTCRNYCRKLYFHSTVPTEYKWLNKIKTALRLNNLDFFHWLHKIITRWTLAHEIGHVASKRTIDAFEHRTGEDTFKGKIRCEELIRKWQDKKEELSELLANIYAARAMHTHDPTNNRRFLLFISNHMNGTRPHNRKARDVSFYSRYGFALLGEALTQPNWAQAVDDLEARLNEQLHSSRSYDELNQWLKGQEKDARKKIYEYHEIQLS